MKKKMLSLLIVSAMMLGTAAFAVDTEEDTAADIAEVTAEGADEAVIGGTDTETEIAVLADDDEEENPTVTADDASVASPDAAEATGAKQVAVYVDSTLILFNDQQPVIKDDFTLVPVRGVFEAMDSRVKWDGEARTVTINSYNNLIRIVLTIDDNVMSVYHFTSIMSADKTEVTLDVAPQIMNDRTMIPLRAISEALGTDVAWDGEKYEVHITTEGASSEAEDKLTLSLTADKTEVKAGEEVTLSAVLTNLELYPETYVSAVTAAVSYDKNNFTFVKAYMCDAEGNDLGAMGADNSDYTADSLKTVYVTIDGDAAVKADGAVLKLVFEAKNDAKSSFALADRYNSKLGNDTTILLSYLENNKTKMIEGKDLVIDTTPVTVNDAAKAVVPVSEEAVDDETSDLTDTDLSDDDLIEEKNSDLDDEEIYSQDEAEEITESDVEDAEEE